MFICKNCQHTHTKWSGQCSGCQEWNTLEETTQFTGKGIKKTKKLKANNIQSLTDHKSEVTKRIPVQSKELELVLGGGIVPGGYILLSGEPGIGKSTLSLQMADWISSTDTPILYISGEEGISQISERARRLEVDTEHIDFLHEQNMETIVASIQDARYPLIIVDSISVMYSDDLDSGIGSIGQIRKIAEIWMQYSKKTNTTVVLIGHVTKDGELAGPKTLEHLVDTVLFLEGNKHDNYRLLRTRKNRFGPTDETGIFVMEENGLQDLKNPGEYLKESEDRPGSALTLTMEGSRAMMIEIEVLTNHTKFGYPKRSVSGVPTNKVDLIVAALEKYGKINLSSDDIFVKIGHGFRVSEPAIDMSVAASILSSKTGQATQKSVWIGEISLTGIFKNANNTKRRVQQAIKMGFERIYVPKESKKLLQNIETGSTQIHYLHTIEELTNIFR